MNKNQTKNSSEFEILKNKYDRNTFYKFISALTKTCTNLHPLDQVISSSYSQYIKKCKQLCSFKDPKYKNIVILEVVLPVEHTLFQAKVAQRNFINHLLKKLSGSYSAALVAFIVEDSHTWRFSLVTSFSQYNEQGEIELRESPAKRYSFVVGPNEGTYTIQKRLLPLLTMEGVPTLQKIEESFSVEAVTNDFFIQYKDLFVRLKDTIEQQKNENNNLNEHFNSKEITSSALAKKILGQMVFLYFLQKKGWLGVKEGEQWASGDKEFFKNQFGDNRLQDGYDFFQNILNPLFYKALATQRENHNFELNGDEYKIPFLNGSLFEPINGFQWQDYPLNIPNSFFSNGDNGVIDIFGRYNFTVIENMPLETEMAVDPEMLGKIFESLLEENIRAKRGAFYTPRKIVHYMVKESLIQYLYTKTGDHIPLQALELLMTLELLETNESLSSEEKGYVNLLQKYASDLDLYLKQVKICDPAVGSGAFPLGILQEIVRIRKMLLPNREESIYQLKKYVIEHNIYGVDIDPEAIEIARLRLWLSLIIEQEDPDKLGGLPNLEYKLSQGDSLIKQYKGVQLFDEQLLHKKASKQKTFGFDPISTFENLRNNIIEWINATPDEKTRLNDEISKDKWKLVQQTLEQNKTKVQQKDIQYLKFTNKTPFFLWKLEFFSVFKKHDGFDIIIGNPPYGGNIDEANFPILDRELGSVPDKEIYYYFVQLAKYLLNKEGILSYIIPNTWLTNTNACEYKKSLLDQWNFLEVIDCKNFEIFQEATVYNTIILFKNGKSKQIGYKLSDQKHLDTLLNQPRKFIKRTELLKHNDWAILFSNKYEHFKLIVKIKQSSKTVHLQEHFAVKQGMKPYDKYVKRDVSPDEQTWESFEHKLKTKSSIKYRQKQSTIKNRVFHFKISQTDGLDKWLQGKDVTPLSITWETRQKGDKYIKYGPWLATPLTRDVFEGKRLLVREITSPSIYATITENSYFHDPGVIIIKPKEETEVDLLNVVLGIIHSKIGNFIHFNGSMKANKTSFPKIIIKGLQEFPIPSNISNDNEHKKALNKLIKLRLNDPFLENPKSDEYNDEAIDQLVFKLYKLKPKEIKQIQQWST